MYLTYTVLMGLGLLVVFPYYAARFRKYMPTMGERLGFVSPMEGRRPIWIHAVSVGELRAVGPLIDAVSTRRPDQPIVVSTTTPSGRALAKEMQSIARVHYFPLDLPGVVRRTLSRIRPELVIIAETEIWPNFLRRCQQIEIPVFMVNGRISDKSYPRYRLARRWLGHVLKGYTLLGMQSDEDARRIIEVGAPAERVRVLGNLKYDSGPASTPLDRDLRSFLADFQPLVVAASTARGEEFPVIEAFQVLRARQPDVRMLLAPRRAEQFDEACRALDRAGLRWHRRSALPSVETGFEVLVLDSFGELNAAFEFASVVFMGGTLVPRGGHNILEPARMGKPVLFGPHMENFRDMAREFLGAGAAIEVRSGKELGEQMAAVLDSPESCTRMTTAAVELIRRNTGATGRALDAILEASTPVPPVPAHGFR